MIRPNRAGISILSGYTLVEILVATTISLMLLAGVITMFGKVGESVTNARALLETSDRLRLAAERLQQDLAGVTVTMIPPRKPEANEGYFEYIEGPVTQATASTVAVNTDNLDTNGNPKPDPTVGDFDDILMFTTRTSGRPFVGKCGGTTIQSDVAEVAWFLRGRTLHRRVLLVAPSAFTTASTTNFYTNYDISAHISTGTTLVPNTLGDLTRRECRFAHTGSFPFDIGAVWYWKIGSYTFPTLPTLNECTVGGWTTGLASPASSLPSLDPWTNGTNYRLGDTGLSGGASGTRVADDIILTNVIGFDVKAYDPVVVVQATTVATGVTGYFFPSDAGYAAALGNVGNTVGGIAYSLVSPYRNLGFAGVNYAAGNARSVGHLGHNRSSLRASSTNLSRVYDSYSTSHFSSNGANGLDDDNDGIVDNEDENWPAGNDLAPPYPYPLRGVQVKIRVFEPDSRQIREVTIVQDFLPQ